MALYEVYLPLSYNDGRPVESEKLDRTRRELSEKFGGLTSTPPGYPLQGWWHSGSELVSDSIVIYSVLTHEDENGFFRQYKEILRNRFEQEEILIVKIPASAL